MVLIQDIFESFIIALLRLQCFVVSLGATLRAELAEVCAGAAQLRSSPVPPAGCRSARRAQAGFTLVELLIVVAILAILAGMVIALIAFIWALKHHIS